MKVLQVEMNNRKGHTLRGVVTLPEGAAPFKTLVNLHGFGGSRAGYKSIHIAMARELAENGIACVRFDFYGNGESDGEFDEMTFTGLLEDTEDICLWVKEQPYADKEKIILSGQSLGGFVAASAAPRVQPYALLLMCPGAGMWYGCRERSKELEEKGVAYGDIEGLKFSHAFNYDLAEYNPYEDAKGFEGQVLILLGTADKLVDDAACEKYLSLYREDSRLVHIEGADHNFASLPARTELHREICRFCQGV